MKNKFVEFNEKLCFKCLEKKENISKYEIKDRGYGSIFDGSVHILQLCDDCNDEKDNLKEWFNELPGVEEDYCEIYDNEEKIQDFVNNKLNIQGKELFWNQTSNEIIDSQDWIDIHLGIASDDTYERNGLYSPSKMEEYIKKISNITPN